MKYRNDLFHKNVVILPVLTPGSGPSFIFTLQFEMAAPDPPHAFSDLVQWPKTHVCMMKSLLFPTKVHFGGIMNPSPLKKPNYGLGTNVKLFFLSCFIYFQYQNNYTEPACESKPTTQACLSNVGRVIIWIKFSQSKILI